MIYSSSTLRTLFFKMIVNLFIHLINDRPYAVEVHFMSYFPLQSRHVFTKGIRVSPQAAVSLDTNTRKSRPPITYLKTVIQTAAEVSSSEDDDALASN